MRFYISNACAAINGVKPHSFIYPQAADHLLPNLGE